MIANQVEDHQVVDTPVWPINYQLLCWLRRSGLDYLSEI
jgi:hypothetical protein